MTCAKQTVIAIIEADGIAYVGTNVCHRPQQKCPRLPGEGYEKCATVCMQTAHAEINALRADGDAARGAVMQLRGHTYACAACTAAAQAAGILRIEIL